MSDYDCVEYTTEGYTVDPCPFCGSTHVELFVDYVGCERCGAQGPRLSNWELVVKLWNDMPRLKGVALKKQRACWASRYRREKQIAQRVALERRKAERNSPEVKRDREYRRWAQQRAAWLNAPIERPRDG